MRKEQIQLPLRFCLWILWHQILLYQYFAFSSLNLSNYVTWNWFYCWIIKKITRLLFIDKMYAHNNILFSVLSFSIIMGFPKQLRCSGEQNLHCLERIYCQAKFCLLAVYCSFIWFNYVRNIKIKEMLLILLQIKNKIRYKSMFY